MEMPDANASDQIPYFMEFDTLHTLLENIRFRLGEAAYFIDRMKTHEDSFIRAVKRKQKQYAIEARREFLYFLLAFLSSVGAVRYYICRATPRKDHAKAAWRLQALSGVLFDIFSDMRDFETHKETVRLGTTFVFPDKGGPPGPQAIEALEGAFTKNDFSKSGPPRLGIDVDHLADVGKQKRYREFLGEQNRGIAISLCEEYLYTLTAVVEDGVSKKHLG